MTPRLLLLIALGLTACAPRKALKEGAALEEQGRDWAAAQRYVEVLEKKPGHAKLSAALAEVAQDAWAQELRRAEEAEEKEQWNQAREHYGNLRDFALAAKRSGVEGLDAEWAGQKLDEVTVKAAERRYLKGQAFQAKGQWAEAVEAYGSALELVPDYQDAVARVAACHDGWGDDLAGDGAWREALRHFHLAASGGVAAATAKQAGLYLALGAHHLKAESCRQSVRDLRAADGLSEDAEIDRLLPLAVDCATHPVGVRPVRNAVEDRIVDDVRERFGVDRQAEAVALAEDAFLSRLRQGASEFLPVLDDAQIKARPSKAKVSDVVDHLVKLQLSELSYGREFRDKERQQVTGEWERPCGDDLCREAVDVDFFDVYKTHWAEAELQLVIARADGREELLSEPREAQVESTAHWAEGFQVAEQPVAIGAEFEPGLVVLPEELLALAAAPQQPEDPWVLAQQAAAAAGENAAGRVLVVLDAEPPWEDPATLEWAPLQ